MKGEDHIKLRRAKKKVEELKGFYWHLAIYLIVNTTITVLKLIRVIPASDGFADFSKEFFDFGTFSTWFFWGIGLVFHALKVFSLNPVFGKNWEEKEIQKFIDREKREIEKFR